MQKRHILVLCGILLLSLFSGCGKSNPNTATVESVSSITGAGYLGQNNRFAGVVAPQSETVIKKEAERVISEIKVAVGDNVTAGQVLFTYDIAATQLSLEKAQLELTQTQNNIASLQTQKADLEKSRANAGSAEQLNYTLEIKEIQTQILEAQYNLSTQQQEVEKLQQAVEQSEVTSPVDGIIKTLKTDESSGMESGSSENSDAFITIMQTGTLQITGTINESTRSAFDVGSAVLIRSRVDDQSWKGTITKIDWDSPIEKTNTDYSSSDPMTTSSSYPFYVELQEDDGLLLGQHVYIEADNGQEDQPEGIYLPAYYLNDIDEQAKTAWVWAANSKNKLERRTLTLGDYLEESDSWLITDGLTLEDLLAIPDDTLEEGMKTEEYDPNAPAENPEGEMDFSDGEIPEADLPVEEDFSAADQPVTDDAVPAETEAVE